MDIDELLDIAETVRSGMRGSIDSRFRITRFVRDYENDNLIGYMDYIVPGGESSTSPIVIDKEQCDVLSVDQIVDYIQMQVVFANDDLVEFVR